MAEVGSLHVTLGADTAQFKTAMEAAQKELAAVGKRMKAVGDSMSKVGQRLSVGLTAPLVAMGYAASRAATESADALGQVEARLKSMGPAAGRTAKQLQEAAEKMQGMSVVDDDEILRSLTANMLSFGYIAGEQFDRAQQAALDMSAALRTDLQSAAIMVGKALNDPAKGVTALAKAGIQFTAQQKTAIQAMLKTNDIAGAQKIVLAELERQFAGSAKAMRDADPWASARDSMNRFLEAVGPIINNALVPLVDAVARVAQSFTDMSPASQRLVLGLAAAAAATGPLLIGAASLITAFGTVSVALAATTAAAGPAAVAMRVLGASFGFLAGPWGLAILAIAAAFGVLYARTKQLPPANEAVRQTTSAVTKATEAYKTAAGQAAVLTGEAAKKSRELAEARRREAVQTIKAAQAELAGARAKIAAISAVNVAAIKSEQFNFRGDAPTHYNPNRNRAALDQAKSDAKAAQEAFDVGSAALREADALLAAPPPTASAYEYQGDKDTPKKDKAAGRSGPTPEDLRLQARIEVARASGDEAAAQALEDQADLKQRIAAYDDAGLGKVAARAAGERDLRELQGARAEAAAEERRALTDAAVLASAQAAGQEDEVRALENTADLEQRIKAYRATRLPLEEATARALRDQETVEAGRKQGQEERMRDMQDELNIQVAQIAGDTHRAEMLQRSADIHARVLAYQREEKPLVEAIAKATADQLAIDRARATARAKWLADRRAEHALRLAELRLDEEAARRLRRNAEISDRARDFRENDRTLSEVDARQRASAEVGREDTAALQGRWREVVRGGTRAAFEGDLAGYLQERIADATARGLERGADMLADWAWDFAKSVAPELFPDLGGDLLGAGEAAGEAAGNTAAAVALTSAGATAAASITAAGSALMAALSGVTATVGTALGAVGTTLATAITTAGMSVAAAIGAAGASSAGASALVSSLPGFANGGSFTVGGRGGIDRNLVQFRASRGERVDISKPGALRTGAVELIQVAVDKSPLFETHVQRATAPMVGQAGTVAVRTAEASVPMNAQRNGRHRFI
jgi:hypothetical protein